jgi:bisphosphoglycerate-independent phosphoglycerate mutase (AlkP superfamily)
MAGLRLRNREDLQQGQAISALFSNDHWPEPNVVLPSLTAYQAGEQLANLSTSYTLTFFEFWYSDILGHKLEREASIEMLGQLDAFLAGVLTRLDLAKTLLLVVSDHGNFEDWTTKKHTTNPALTILAGNDVARLAPRLRTLVDIKPLVLDYLFGAA